MAPSPATWAKVEERRCFRKIVLRVGKHLVGVDHLMAYREAGVPQRIEQCLDEASGRRVALLRARRNDDAHVGVAAQGDRAAPIAPDRGQAKLIGATDGRVRRGEEGAHQPIEHLSVPYPEA